MPPKELFSFESTDFLQIGKSVVERHFLIAANNIL